MNISFTLKRNGDIHELHQDIIYCRALPTPSANQTNFRKGMLEKRDTRGRWEGGLRQQS